MNRQIEKHERVMGSEGVIPVSIINIIPYRGAWAKAHEDATIHETYVISRHFFELCGTVQQ